MKKQKGIIDIIDQPDFCLYYSQNRGHYVGWIYEQVYDQNINLIWEINAEQHCRFIKDMGTKYDDNFGNAMAKTTVLEDGNRSITISLTEWKVTPKHMGYLSHEIYHVVDYMFGMRGWRCDHADNGEPMAYLIGSLTRRCLCLLNHDYDGHKKLDNRKKHK